MSQWAELLAIATPLCDHVTPWKRRRVADFRVGVHTVAPHLWFFPQRCFTGVSHVLPVTFNLPRSHAVLPDSSGFSVSFYSPRPSSPTSSRCSRLYLFLPAPAPSPPSLKRGGSHLRGRIHPAVHLHTSPSGTLFSVHICGGRFPPAHVSSVSAAYLSKFI